LRPGRRRGPAPRGTRGWRSTPRPPPGPAYEGGASAAPPSPLPLDTLDSRRTNIVRVCLLGRRGFLASARRRCAPARRPLWNSIRRRGRGTCRGPVRSGGAPARHALSAGGFYGGPRQRRVARVRVRVVHVHLRWNREDAPRARRCGPGAAAAGSRDAHERSNTRSSSGSDPRGPAATRPTRGARRRGASRKRRLARGASKARRSCDQRFGRTWAVLAISTGLLDDGTAAARRRCWSRTATGKRRPLADALDARKRTSV
jgi:hypothetical protein